MTTTKQPKIGLALGSGGPKGLAHIGVIKILEENNIPIHFIAGSSIGAMIGGFYAATKDIKQIEETALGISWRQVSTLIDPSLRQGLLGGEKIKTFIKKHINEVHFKDLKIPFSAVATDMKNGDVVSMDKGELSSAIRASISFPLVLKPVEREGRLLTDGALSMPVPVEVVRKMGAELIIAINLDTDYFTNNNKVNFGFYRIANNSIGLLRHHLASWNIRDANLVIAPRFDNIRWNKFLDGKDIILTGEEAMKGQLSKLQELIHQKSQSN